MIETSFSELVLWRRELVGAEMPATIPPSSSRPNPCLADGLLVSSILQGFAVAHDPQTGDQVWRRELGRFGAASVYAAGGNLYARSDTTLYALAPETGEVRWRFTPIRDRPETVYSSPIVHGRRLFLGDRQGFLHCLDNETGRSLWSVRSSKAPKGQVNCTPAVHGETVIVSLAHRPGQAVAFRCDDGEEVWTTRLDGPSAGEVLVVGGSVLIEAENTVVRLDPETGAVRDRYRWPPWEIRGLCARGSSFAVILETGLSGTEALRLHFGPPSRGSSIEIPGRSPSIGWSRRTGCVYVRCFNSVAVVEPDAPELRALIRYDPDSASRHTLLGGIADADRDRIYVLGDAGTLYALRHP